MKKSLLMLLMVGVTVSAMAQTTRTLKGVVVDQNGNPLSGAKVEAKEFKFKDSTGETMTDADGTYELELSEKQNVIGVQYQGYADVAMKIKPNVSNLVVWMDPIKDYNRWLSKRYWPSPFYLKLSLGKSNFPSKASFSSTGNFSYTIEFGGTIYLHKKPVANALKFGFDVLFELSPEIYNDNYYKSQIYETFSIGPSAWFAPFTRSSKEKLSLLGFSTFYHVGYGWGQLNSNYSSSLLSGSGMKHSVGLGLYYKRFRLGYEHEWRNMKYDGDKIKSSANYLYLAFDLGKKGTANKSLVKAVRDNKQRVKMTKTVGAIPQSTKTIRGLVTDKKGNPISGALVEATGGAENTYTGPDGAFILEVPKWLLSVTTSYGDEKKTLNLDGKSDLHFKIKGKKK